MEFLKKHKWGIIIAALLLAIIIWWFVFRNKGTGNTDLPAPGSNPFPLGPGSKGPEVKKLQLWVFRTKGIAFPKYGFDGEWGRISTETTDNVYKATGLKEISRDFYEKNKIGDEPLT